MATSSLCFHLSAFVALSCRFGGVCFGLVFLLSLLARSFVGGGCRCVLLVIPVFVIHFGSSFFEFVSRLGVACLFLASEDFGSHHFVSPIEISPLPSLVAWLWAGWELWNSSLKCHLRMRIMSYGAFCLGSAGAKLFL